MTRLTPAQVSSRDLQALKQFVGLGLARSGNAGKRLQKAGLVAYQYYGVRMITLAGFAALAAQKEQGHD